MVVLHTISEEFCQTQGHLATVVTDWYTGTCPVTGQALGLPRTALVEAIAHQLMQNLAQSGQSAREGKMYGVLLVDQGGEWRVLRAFSGLLNGCSLVPGWVPPIPGREQVAQQEAETVEALAQMKQELIDLSQLPERQRYRDLLEQQQQQLQALTIQHQQRKAQRQQQRQQLLTGPNRATLEALEQESQRDGIERRQLKRQQASARQPLQTIVEQAEQRIQVLKQQRQQLSRSLQEQMHAAYCLTNFAGISRPLQQLMPEGMPTGTGDCCAPKLLHYAATQGLKPLAMAEFWWGPPQGDKVPGQFYGACAERCQPLMGFLLSGLVPAEPLPVVYEDDWLVAIAKPAGLLSVPGRYADTQDSVLSRLRLQGQTLWPVHRLDQDTSGLLLLARDVDTHRQVSQQFQQHQVHKVYTAVVVGIVQSAQGVIDLPLGGDPERRPYQVVDKQRGKPSLTEFAVLARGNGTTRLKLTPRTGRTHQLRVHCQVGLGCPIVGDRLYGDPAQTERLHLHACELWLQHPHTGQPLHLRSGSPF